MTTIRDRFETVLENLDAIAVELFDARAQLADEDPMTAPSSVEELTLTIETIGLLQVWAHESIYGAKPSYTLIGRAARQLDPSTTLHLIRAERASARRAVETEEFHQALLQPQ